MGFRFGSDRATLVAPRAIERQDRVQIVSPIPDRYMRDAARLWWGTFAPPLWVRVPRIRARHGIAAIGADGCVMGVTGLRDSRGGLLADMPWLARVLYRAAPPTDDLVIDGLVVREPGRGTGRALLDRMAEMARETGHPGLRAEVALRNPAAMSFYAATGFTRIGQGRFGWPWSGPVAVLHRPV